MAHRVLAVVTDPLDDDAPIDEIRRRAEGPGSEVRVVVPAAETSPFRHALGDLDEPTREAEETLEASLAALRDHGVTASGEVGDADPVLAAADALREAPADEVLIFNDVENRARWFEIGLFDRARAMLEAPLRLVMVEEREDGARVVAVESGRRGTGL
jgi:hypothetical protein